jgi:DNA-binding transcriptional LysR family regulator
MAFRSAFMRLPKVTSATTLGQAAPAGVAFLPDARRILQLAEGAAQTVKRIPEGDLGTVVVGFSRNGSGRDNLVEDALRLS